MSQTVSAPPGYEACIHYIDGVGGTGRYGVNLRRTGHGFYRLIGTVGHAQMTDGEIHALARPMIEQWAGWDRAGKTRL